MDLDDRAAHAADALRRQVEPSLDVARARASVRAGVGSHRCRTGRGARAGATALAVVAVVGVLAVAGGAGGGNGVLATNGDDGVSEAERTRAAASAARAAAILAKPSRSAASEARAAREARAVREAAEAEAETQRTRVAAILGAMPTVAIEGRASWPLPVLAHPQSGLRDGETVRIYGRGFEPNESVDIVQCTSEADTAGAGVTACQLAGNRGLDADTTNVTETVIHATASAEGDVVADFVVRRYVTTPAGGQVDCLTTAERCLVGVGAVNDDERSGGGYISFADAPPFPDPVMAVDPVSPYAPGQQVRVDLAGMVAGRDLLVQQCVEERCQDLIDAKVDVTGSAGAGVAVRPSIVDAVSGDEIACQDRCVLRVNDIGVDGQSSAPLPDPIELRFTSERPGG